MSFPLGTPSALLTDALLKVFRPAGVAPVEVGEVGGKRPVHIADEAV